MTRNTWRSCARVVSVSSALVIIVAFLGGCRLDTTNESATGIPVALSLSSRTGGSELQDDIHLFRIRGYRLTNPSSPGLEYEQYFENDGDLYLVEALRPGDWRFDVFALNQDGEVLLFGTAEVLVSSVGSNSVKVILIPEGGPEGDEVADGELLIEFRDSEGYLEDLDVTAHLARYLGGAEFAAAEELSCQDHLLEDGIGIRRYQGSHAAGHYRLAYEAQDSEDGSAWTELSPPSPINVHIVPTQQSVVTIDLQTGEVEFEIEHDFREPIVVTLSGDVEPGAEVPLGTAFTITADTVEPPPGLEYRWYLNGDPQDGEDEAGITFDAQNGLSVGAYRLSVIVLAPDVLGSAWISFRVVE